MSDEDVVRDTLSRLVNFPETQAAFDRLTARIADLEHMLLQDTVPMQFLSTDAELRAENLRLREALEAIDEYDQGGQPQGQGDIARAALQGGQ